MGLFDGQPTIRVIELREDYKLDSFTLPVDKVATEVISKTQNGKRKDSWLYIHQLLKPVYGYPGIQDGTLCQLISRRDVRYDPLGELDESWNDEHIRDKMAHLAHEMQNKVEESAEMGWLQRSQFALSITAGFLILIVCIIALVKFLPRVIG